MVVHVMNANVQVRMHTLVVVQVLVVPVQLVTESINLVIVVQDTTIAVVVIAVHVKQRLLVQQHGIGYLYVIVSC